MPTISCATGAGEEDAAVGRERVVLGARRLEARLDRRRILGELEGDVLRIPGAISSSLVWTAPLRRRYHESAARAPPPWFASVTKVFSRVRAALSDRHVRERLADRDTISTDSG